MRYYIYHIPNFIQKDGKIGKIGTSHTPADRVKEQGYTDFEILEEHTDIYKASEREIQLQKEYGYKVDCVLYYQSVENWRKKKRNGHSTPSETIIESLDGKFKKIYISLSEGCRALDLDKGNAHKVAINVYSQTKGYRVTYTKNL